MSARNQSVKLTVYKNRAMVKLLHSFVSPTASGQSDCLHTLLAIDVVDLSLKEVARFLA